MTKKDFRIIAVSIYHIIALMLLFVTLSLLLDYRFRGHAVISITQINPNLGFEHKFGFAACILGMVSAGLIISGWIKNQTVELYLGSILISEAVLFLGVIILTFLY